MGPRTSIIRYRKHPLERVALCLPGPIALGLWVSVIIQTGETDQLPVVILLSAAIGLACWWIGQAPCVALTPDALVIRSLRGTETLTWSAISMVERRTNAVWAMSSRGWFVLPIGATRRAVDPPPEALPLAEQVWFTWHALRGPHWAPTALDPWTPRRDLRGRAVLRPPLLPRLGVLTITVNALVWSLIPYRTPNQRLSTQLGGAALVFGVTLTLVAAYHLWARVTIDDEYLVTRSLTGVTHIHRRDVQEILECPGSDWSSRTSLTRLGLRHAEPQITPGPNSMWWASFRVTSLAAPVACDRAWANDPAFYRTWAWLYDELFGAAATAEPERTAPAT